VPCSHAAQTHAPNPAYRLTWARPLARVFRVGVTVCPACGGKMKVIAELTLPMRFAPTSTVWGWIHILRPSRPRGHCPRPNSNTPNPRARRREGRPWTSGHVCPPASRSAAFPGQNHAIRVPATSSRATRRPTAYPPDRFQRHGTQPGRPPKTLPVVALKAAAP
jgi:hypothetical protein